MSRSMTSTSVFLCRSSLSDTAVHCVSMYIHVKSILVDNLKVFVSS